MAQDAVAGRAEVSKSIEFEGGAGGNGEGSGAGPDETLRSKEGSDLGKPAPKLGMGVGLKLSVGIPPIMTPIEVDSGTRLGCIRPAIVPAAI